MAVNHLEIFVEELSMEQFLLRSLPRWLPAHVRFSIYTYNGKGDLLRKLPSRLLGYASWLPEDFGIVVIVDQDEEDCFRLKNMIEESFAAAGISTKLHPANGRFVGLSRIAIRELEAWYFGNWGAVIRAYPRLPRNIPMKAAYRESDSIADTWESFERVCRQNGVFSTGLRKVEAARAIGEQFDAAENTSPSFRAFQLGLLSMVGSPSDTRS